MSVSVDEAATNCQSDDDPTCVGHGQKRYASVQNVAALPLECKHNMILKVKNSIAEEDDYYVQFKGNQDKDGEGVWEETVEPGNYNKLDGTTMPYRIVRGPADVNGIFTFVVQEIPWDPRKVGDPLTNPFPSFIDRRNPTSDTFTKPIERTIFYRNRLCLLAGENILMSRPGDYFNFWSLSALNVSVSDPIDSAASSEYSSLLLDAIVVNTGLILFSEFQQFLLTTDSDILSPQTVKINNLSSYDFNPNTSPFAMGNTVGFFSSAGLNSRMYEMYQIFREGEPDVIEQSKILNRRLPKDITELAESKENGLIMGSVFGSSDMYCYRYFNQGNERLQSAWFRWNIPGKLQYHVILGDVYYAVTTFTNTTTGVIKYLLSKLDLSERYSTTDVSGETFDYRIHLDYLKHFENADLTYNESGPNAGKTTFDLANYPWQLENLYAYTLDGGGKYESVYVNYDIDASTIIGCIKGDRHRTVLA